MSLEHQEKSDARGDGDESTTHDTPSASDSAQLDDAELHTIHVPDVMNL